MKFKGGSNIEGLNSLYFLESKADAIERLVEADEQELAISMEVCRDLSNEMYCL